VRKRATREKAGVWGAGEGGVEMEFASRRRERRAEFGVAVEYGGRRRARGGAR